MSEYKMVSPLLDGFMMGDPISSHDGVRCCPAMRENSDDKYIVKIISVPASQKQLDALLLTGAYRSTSDAAEYFKELAEDTVKEAKLLQQLAKLEGFLSYENWQIEPLDDGNVGYDVYLLGSYKRSLEKHLRRNTMTHLSAVNLGIDLCTALSLCRRAGFIYTDLKPTNIFISDKGDYRIGDLGFAKLSAMKYTSLPTKYLSCYTPPELHDVLSTLNPTVDTYAVGMILYQIYNNGKLPYTVKAPMRTLPAPLNADYEMAEIILKACDPNPRKRYQTPIEMGQALVSYLQRNSINDIPIVPPAGVAVAASEQMPAESSPVSEEVADQAEVTETPADTPEELHFLDDLVSDDTAPGADEADDLAVGKTTGEVDSILAQADALISHQPDIHVDSVQSDVLDAAFEEADEDEDEDDAYDDEFEDNEAEDEDVVASEKDPASDIPSVPDTAQVSEDDDDVFKLAFGDKTVTATEQESGLEFGLPTDPEDADSQKGDFFGDEKPKKKKGWIGILVAILILALLGTGGYYYYEQYYLIPIDNMEINGLENSVSVSLSTEADESLLQVVCTDTYGNKQVKALSNGKAEFTDLNPATSYKITVEVEGFHKLTGSFSGNYTTAEETNIVDFTAKTGNEDGSVILNFTVDGPETQDWIVEYTAEGEEPQSVSFTGHMVTITDLTVGKLYTFTLNHEPSADLYLQGNTSLEYLATKLVVAKNLSIVSCIDGVLTTQWTGSEDTPVESWTVRCYSENGYDETITVTDTTAQFSGITTDHAYTVEVIASGMTQSTRAFVTANPATITDIQVSYADESGISLTWQSELVPAGGWLVMYSVDGSETTQMAECTDNTATVKTVIPEAEYTFQIMAADGSTVFGGHASYTTDAAEAFNGHLLSASAIQSSLCRTPSKENWTHEDVKDTAYTTFFAEGEKASLVLYASSRFYLEDHETTILYVIRDAEGRVIPNLCRSETKIWRDLWPGIGKYCYLDIPVMPTGNGDYTLELYFDGGEVLAKNFSIITTNG